MSSNKAEFDKGFLQSRIKEFKRIVEEYYEDIRILLSVSKT
ncbi:MAG: hypothetical protein QXN81_00965 [Candidatus Bathyarchaeia archaeon]